MIWVASLIAVVLIAFIVYNEAMLRQRQTASVLPSNTASAAVSATASAAVTEVAAANTSPSPDLSGSPEATDSGSPSPAASAPASPSADGASTLEVRLSASSWLRVTVDGNVSMEGTFPAGTVRQFRGKTARLRIGNAGGVEIIVDGKSLGTLGAAGDVVERSFTL